jgi:para-nitrobenzyl esterase
MQHRIWQRARRGLGAALLAAVLLALATAAGVRGGAPLPATTAAPAATAMQAPAPAVKTAVPAATGTAVPGAATVRVDSGLLAGVERNGVVVFQGVPYAAPPVGELRWRAPGPPAPWPGERPATAPGAICMQRRGAEDGASEDCLTLQVFAPKGAHGAPVMVWLHGGANFFGSSAAPFYDGSSFARDGVVLVAANYRLGPFGFFAHPTLTRAAAPGEALANYALMDQIAALRWVERNAAAFGGDPKRVTVFGESAGGTDVLALLATPAARGLFAQAIVESPGSAWDPLPSLRDAETEGEHLAAAAGLAGGAATPAALRALPAARLLGTQHGEILPVLDGTLLVESPAAAFARGHAARVPLIIGSNSYEASLIEGGAATVQPEAETRVGHAGEDTTPQAQWAALFTDKYFGAPVRWYARRAAPSAPTWLYYFSYVRVSQRSKVPGAPHGSEIPYVFDSWDRISARAAFLPAEDRAMTALVHGLWVAFAKTGAPVSPNPKLPPWPAYSAERDELMDLGIVPAVRSHFRQSQLDAQERAAAATLPAATH